MKKNHLKKLAVAGFLSAFALTAFMLENLLPPLFIPGAKLGLSNIFVLLAAILLGGSYGFAVLAVKCVLGSLFSGNISALMYSLPAGIIALSSELLILRFTSKTSVIAASTCGSVLNTTVQNVVFCLVTGSPEYLCYLPYLALIGAAAGVAVGATVFFAVKRLPEYLLKKFNLEE